MNIKLKTSNFIEETDVLNVLEDGISRETTVKLSKLFVKGIEKQIQIAQNIINFISRKTENNSFISLINELYEISLTNEDYYSIFSLAYNKRFEHHLMLMPTYMVIEDINFLNPNSVWEEKRITLKVAYTEDFSRRTPFYTKEEIRKLLKEKKIVILDKFKDKIDGAFSKSMYQSYESFNIHRNYQNLSEDNIFYPYIIMYIRNMITDKKMYTDINQYLVRIRTQINECLSKMEQKAATIFRKELEKTGVLNTLEELIKESQMMIESNNQQGRIDLLSYQPEENVDISWLTPYLSEDIEEDIVDVNGNAQLVRRRTFEKTSHNQL